MAKRATSYESWLRDEGIPVIGGYGIEDVTVLPRKPWRRTGGSGAYIDLKGMEGFTGMYVCEIPAGGALHPENHLYEELIYVIKGIGATDFVCRRGQTQAAFRMASGELIRYSAQHTPSYDQRQQ